MFKDTDKSLEDYLRNIHHDYVYPFMVIHDEVDYIVDNFLLKPIMTKISRISEVSRVFDKLGYKFVRFVFDLEYDDWGSFTASKSFSQYEYSMKSLMKSLDTKEVQKKIQKEQPLDHGKSNIMQDNIIEKVDDDINNDDSLFEDDTIQAEEVYIKVNVSDLENFLNKVENLPSGQSQLFVIVNNEIWKNDKQYDYDQLIKLKEEFS